MDEPRRLSLKNKLLLLLVPAILTAALMLWLYLRYPEVEQWRDGLDNLLAWLESYPWALVLAVMLLPGIGFPTSILLVTFGGVIGPLYGSWTACLIGILALSVCSLWTYLLAAGPLRGFLQTFLLRKRSLPEFHGRNAYRVSFILRATPGIPYAIQNVALGVMGIDLKTYLIVSLPVQSLYAIGFILTSGAIFEGNAGLAVTGGALLVVLVVLTRLLRQRRKQTSAPPPIGEDPRP